MEKTPIGRRSVARAAIAREPEGTWTTGGCREGDADYRSDERELHCVFFHLVLKKLLLPRAMSAKPSLKYKQ